MSDIIKDNIFNEFGIDIQFCTKFKNNVYYNVFVIPEMQKSLNDMYDIFFKNRFDPETHTITNNSNTFDFFQFRIYNGLYYLDKHCVKGLQDYEYTWNRLPCISEGELYIFKKCLEIYKKNKGS